MQINSDSNVMLCEEQKDHKLGCLKSRFSTYQLCDLGMALSLTFPICEMGSWQCQLCLLPSDDIRSPSTAVAATATVQSKGLCALQRLKRLL